MFLDVTVQRTGWEISELYKLNRYLETYSLVNEKEQYGNDRKDVIEIIWELQSASGIQEDILCM